MNIPVFYYDHKLRLGSTGSQEVSRKSAVGDLQLKMAPTFLAVLTTMNIMHTVLSLYGSRNIPRNQEQILWSVLWRRCQQSFCWWCPGERGWLEMLVREKLVSHYFYTAAKKISPQKIIWHENLYFKITSKTPKLKLKLNQIFKYNFILFKTCKYCDVDTQIHWSDKCQHFLSILSRMLLELPWSLLGIP